MRNAILLSFTLAAFGCASSDVAPTVPPPTGTARGVTQGGAQDIAHFRAIVAQGNVPAPETLDVTGFFAEHALDLPPATCGRAVCLAPMLAVAPRFDGGNWTMGYVALSTSVDPATLARPPLHLVLVVDPPAASMGYEAGLRRVLAGLRAEDRVSVVRIGTARPLRLHGVAPTDTQVMAEATQTTVSGGLYEGLAEASRAIDTLTGFSGASRILLVTTGEASQGVTDPGRIVALGESLVRRGVALSVVGYGYGSQYRPTIPAALGSLGAGTYSYAESSRDMEAILQVESETLLFPLATDFRMRFIPSPGYRVGRVYGARRAVARGEVIEVDAPALFIGSRVGAQSVGGSRRGGGSGLFVELIPDLAMSPTIGANAPAFRVEATWTNATTRVEESTDAEVRNTLAPGRNPAEMWPSFSDESRSKVFMMLNMYLAFQSTVTFYDNGDCARAQGVIDMMSTSIDLWNRRRPDPDINADTRLLNDLRENLRTRCRAVQPVQPRNFSGGCFYS
jgi:Ca-activated chloride channel family protein